MKQIKLQNKELFISVEDTDFERLSKFLWYQAGDSIVRWIYDSYRARASGSLATKHISIANEIFQTKNKKYDHRDRNPYNCLQSNFRLCSMSTNMANSSKQNRKTSSKYKGVCWHKGAGKWMAGIMQYGKSIYLGLFESEEDAARAYDKKALELFGEFACLNFSAPL